MQEPPRNSSRFPLFIFPSLPPSSSLHIGDKVKVWSHSASMWLTADVSDIPSRSAICVLYHFEEMIFSKEIGLHSKDLYIPAFSTEDDREEHEPESPDCAKQVCAGSELQALAGLSFKLFSIPECAEIVDAEAVQEEEDPVCFLYAALRKMFQRSDITQEERALLREDKKKKHREKLQQANLTREDKQKKILVNKLRQASFAREDKKECYEKKHVDKLRQAKGSRTTMKNGSAALQVCLLLTGRT